MSAMERDVMRPSISFSPSASSSSHLLFWWPPLFIHFQHSWIPQKTRKRTSIVALLPCGLRTEIRRKRKAKIKSIAEIFSLQMEEKLGIIHFIVS